MTQRNCDQLGVCQSRTPPCAGCLPRPAFAPGVVEHHKRRHVRSLARWLGRSGVTLAATLLFIAAFQLGCFYPGFVLSDALMPWLWGDA